MLTEKSFFIHSSTATVDGRALGKPVVLPTNPTIGTVPLPTRPTFMIGRAYATIQDPEEYRETRQRHNQQPT